MKKNFVLNASLVTLWSKVKVKISIETNRLDYLTFHFIRMTSKVLDNQKCITKVWPSTVVLFSSNCHWLDLCFLQASLLSFFSHTFLFLFFFSEFLIPLLSPFWYKLLRLWQLIFSKRTLSVFFEFITSTSYFLKNFENHHNNQKISLTSNLTSKLIPKLFCLNKLNFITPMIEGIKI